MALKKRLPSKYPQRKVRARRKRRRAPARPGKLTTRSLDAIGEAITIMLPELAARMAAVEHLLIEKQLCSHDDLVRSREFIDIRRHQQ